MDRKDRVVDEVLLERFWGSIKHEEACLDPTVKEALLGLTKLFVFQHAEGLGSAIRYRPPQEVRLKERSERKPMQTPHV